MADTSEPAPARAVATVAFEPAFRLDLEQQRKRAKDLRKAFLASDEAARQRFRRHHPVFADPAGEPHRPIKLSDAQLVIAREIGLPSWPRLKAHIVTMQAMRARIETGIAAPDGDMTTLHIRCGSDIRSRLNEAGFAGDFLEYSDPLCQGPVLDGPSWLDRRADFLAAAYAAGTGRSRTEIAEGLAQAEARLASAAAQYQRVVLWFEHDSYDQINLSRCLSQFAETPPARLEMVTLDHYPGAMRFIGLGQLPPEALRLLWDARKPVSRQQMLAGKTVWTLLRQPDPSPLAGARLDALPYLTRAIRRHCQELPWTRDGLGLTERLILELVANRPRTIGAVFRDLMHDREALPWLGDLMLRTMVENMKRASQPVFTAAFDSDDRRWFKERLTITALGHSVLAGDTDWLSLSPPERWLGGVRIRGGAPGWRWHEGGGVTVVR